MFKLPMYKLIHLSRLLYEIYHSSVYVGIEIVKINIFLRPEKAMFVEQLMKACLSEKKIFCLGEN